MSTSTKYSPNKLKDIMINDTQHFVMKSYVTTIFESGMQRAEYYVYWYNKNCGIDYETQRYKNLSNKKMNKKELQYFMDNIHLYVKEMDNEDGCIWVNKSYGFDKNKVKLQKQLAFF